MKLDTLMKVIPLTCDVVVNFNETNVVFKVHSSRNINILNKFGECYVTSITPINCSKIRICVKEKT